VTDDLSDQESERTAFRVVSIDTLPESAVELAGWHGAQVDWYAVSRVAVEIFEARVDPLDHGEVEHRVAQFQLRSSDRSWAEDLFRQPVAIYGRSHL
jgi:hypothetical protein